MFLLRRAAVRAIGATPSKTLLAKSRSIATFTPSTLRTHKQQWSTAFQRRFATDDATKTDAVPENFAQTAAEAPAEDGLTPAQQDAQASPTDAKATVTPDALEELEKVAGTADKKHQRSRDDAVPHKTLYIGNLFYEVTGEQLKKVFSRFGEVESVKIIYDNRGLSRGFAYVDFKSVEDAQTAIDNLNMQVFEGRNLVVQFHRQKPQIGRSGERGPFGSNPASKTLFIGNMSFEMSDKDLSAIFREVRNVLDVRVAVDRRTGQPRGFAHADFLDVASATKAKETLEGRVVFGRPLRIDFGKPHERADRTDRSRGSNRADSGTQE